MRLAAQAKMGYYPTPDRVTTILARYVERQRDGLEEMIKNSDYSVQAQYSLF